MNRVSNNKAEEILDSIVVINDCVCEFTMTHSSIIMQLLIGNYYLTFYPFQL